MLCGKTRRHHLLVKGECDVCTVILVVGVRGALGLHWLQTRRATFPYTSAGAHKALVIQDGDAGLPTRALVVPSVEQARSRATPDLGAGDPSVQALASITVIIPLDPVRYYAPHGDARFP